jgi:hypothetical protein
MAVAILLSWRGLAPRHVHRCEVRYDVLPCTGRREEVGPCALALRLHSRRNHTRFVYHVIVPLTIYCVPRNYPLLPAKTTKRRR